MTDKRFDTTPKGMKVVQVKEHQRGATTVRSHLRHVYPSWKVVEFGQANKWADVESTKLTKGNKLIMIKTQETNDAIIMRSLLIKPEGQGLGTEFVLNMKEYADATGKKIVWSNNNSSGERLLDKFDFLQRRDMLGQVDYIYKPKRVKK